MNNKKVGTAFEREVCKRFAKNGYWVHFLSPDSRGAQPFDIIAVKDGCAVAIECKTLTPDKHFFPFSRLEDNQILAFDKWLDAGNAMPMIYVKWGEKQKVVPYGLLKKEGKVDLNDCFSDFLLSRGCTFGLGETYDLGGL